MSNINDDISDYEEEGATGEATKADQETISDYEDEGESDGIDPMLQAFQGETKQEKTAEELEAEKLAAEQAAVKSEEELAAEKEVAEKLEADKFAAAGEKSPEEIEADKVASELAEKEAKEKKAWSPEFKTDADRALYEKLAKGEQKEVWELLNKKFAYESMPNEQKVIEFIMAKNPDFTQEEAMFVAEKEYGIGAENPTEEELAVMDKEDKSKIMAASIKLKGVLREANTYFKENSDNFELPTLPNPLETDEGYKSYLATKEATEKQQTKDKEIVDKTIVLIDTTANSIKKLVLNDEINLDEGKFEFKVDLDITPKKQAQLAAFAKNYSPTQDEIAAHSKDGKLDMTSYLNYLAEKAFSRSIIKAAVKQAVSMDREKFLTKDLINNKMGNNSDGLPVNIEVDPYTAAMAE